MIMDTILCHHNHHHHLEGLGLLVRSVLKYQCDNSVFEDYDCE
jgi:hypothetical protein